jgi:sugar phosphate isomerase/epimerase
MVASISPAASLRIERPPQRANETGTIQIARMKLALLGETIPSDPAAVDDLVAERVAALGFAGVGVHFGSDPEAVDPAALRRAAEVFATRGVRVVHSWGFGSCLVHPDGDARRRAVRRLEGALRVARELDADAVICGAGSVAAGGGYAPHPDNHGAPAADRLASALREAVAACETHGVAIALEPHVLTVLDRPDRVADVVARVDSPWIGVNLDPVNLLDGLPALYDSGSHLDRVFAALGPVARSGHLKDAYVEHEFVLHLSECPLGEGLFDVIGFIERFAAVLPDGWLFVEHLPDGQVDRAARFASELIAAVERVGT